MLPFSSFVGYRSLRRLEKLRSSHVLWLIGKKTVQGLPKKSETPAWAICAGWLTSIWMAIPGHYTGT